MKVLSLSLSLAAALAAVLGVAPHAGAQSTSANAEARPGAAPAPIAADRPGLLVGPATVPLGYVSVEAGDSHTRAAEHRVHALGELLVRVSVARRAELRLGGGSYETHDSDGAHDAGRGDGSVGVKLLLRAAGDGTSLAPSVAVVAQTSLPTGSRAFARGPLVPAATLSAAWTLPAAFGLLTNMTAAAAPGEQGRWAALSSGVAIARPLGARAGAYVDVLGARGEPGAEPAARHASAGLTYLLTENAQLDGWTASTFGAAPHERAFGFGIALRR